MVFVSQYSTLLIWNTQLDDVNEDVRSTFSNTVTGCTWVPSLKPQLNYMCVLLISYVEYSHPAVLTKMWCGVDKESCHYPDEERFPVSVDFDFRFIVYSIISSRCKVACRFSRFIVQGILLPHREAEFPHSGVDLSGLQSKIRSCQDLSFVSGSPSVGRCMFVLQGISKPKDKTWILQFCHYLENELKALNHSGNCLWLTNFVTRNKSFSAVE